MHFCRQVFETNFTIKYKKQSFIDIKEMLFFYESKSFIPRKSHKRKFSSNTLYLRTFVSTTYLNNLILYLLTKNQYTARRHSLALLDATVD